MTPLPLHIIIDGFNLIRQSPELSRFDRHALESGREALLDLLAVYRRLKPHPITVVFDGVRAPLGSPARDRVQGIRVRYSRQGESADTVIKGMAAEEREKALVVSSDRGISDVVIRFGTAVIDSPVFESRVRAAIMTAGDPGAMADGPDDGEGWIPTTRKKGPRRRASKRERRNRRRIEKL